MIEIVEYKNEYAKELSEIILDNMYKINIKEQGKDIIDRLSNYILKRETSCILTYKKRENSL